MTKVVSFYGASHSQGNRTLSLTMAKMLAESDYKTLYVELDLYKPSVAIATQITDELRNTNVYFQNVIDKNVWSIDPYVLNRAYLLNAKAKSKQLYSHLPDKLDFLVLPIDFNLREFPEIINGEKESEKKAHEFIEKFMYTLNTSNYDYVILKLPVELRSIFGFEMIAASDHVVHIVTPSANRINEGKQVTKFLNNNIFGIEDKLINVINLASKEVPNEEYWDLLEDPVIVPYDTHRQQQEFEMKFGSSLIEESLHILADRLDAELTIQNKRNKKSFFKK
ncbi:AAA family ATPase [Bacillus sp. 1P06AnD]|uniref:AAA family ATPase n=1 Tax=Bacillus sp. 1P06AnD TaxID=3132208 RepID=UPI00399F92CB